MRCALELHVACDHVGHSGIQFCSSAWSRLGRILQNGSSISCWNAHAQACSAADSLATSLPPPQVTLTMDASVSNVSLSER